jgi:hypothetical protein
MTVDFRGTIATDLGVCVSGDIGSNHISDGTGLIKTQGRLTMDGIMTPARGTAVNLLIVRPQLGVITRFPKPMFVLRAVPNIIDRFTEVEIGCRLTLMEGLQRQDVYDALQRRPNDWITVPRIIPLGPERIPIYQDYLAAWTIQAQEVLEYCLGVIGLDLAASSVPLTFRFLRSRIELAQGYVQVIGDLIRSESKFGRILPDGKLEIRNLNFSSGQAGPVLTTDNFYSIDAIDGAIEPPDEFSVQYNGAELGAVPQRTVTQVAEVFSPLVLPLNTPNAAPPG